MTVERRTVPIKKDQLKKTSQSITRLTKEDLKRTDIKRSTEELARNRSEISNRSFVPIWFRHLPMTIEDFRHKEVTWQGFHLALRKIGLDPKEVEQRLKEGKEPWTDKDYTIECCQRPFWEHQTKMPKPAATTKPKSKITRPDDEQERNWESAFIKTG